MRPLIHPPIAEVSLQGVLHALADPARLEMFKRMQVQTCPTRCAALAPEGMAKSTQSFHFQVLREAGLIRSERRGAELVNTPRTQELEARFPGLIAAILQAAGPGGCGE